MSETCLNDFIMTKAQIRRLGLDKHLIHKMLNSIKPSLRIGGESIFTLSSVNRFMLKKCGWTISPNDLSRAMVRNVIMDGLFGTLDSTLERDILDVICSRGTVCSRDIVTCLRFAQMLQFFTLGYFNQYRNMNIMDDGFVDEVEKILEDLVFRVKIAFSTQAQTRLYRSLEHRDVVQNIYIACVTLGKIYNQEERFVRALGMCLFECRRPHRKASHFAIKESYLDNKLHCKSMVRHAMKNELHNGGLLIENEPEQDG